MSASNPQSHTDTAAAHANLERIPRHIAIIMDGNGRWAKQRGQPRLAGHRAGTAHIRDIVEACGDLGIQYLTLFAFSSENWKRPQDEVKGLFAIMEEFLEDQAEKLNKRGVRLRHLGSLEGIRPEMQRTVLDALELTKNNTNTTLAVAFNYGGRADIVTAVRKLVASGVAAEEITEATIAAHLATSGMPDPDLIIRTSGERRLSNFLIWEAAYSEFWATPVYWPDFTAEHLRQALIDYGQRERRFGGLTT